MGEGDEGWGLGGGGLSHLPDAERHGHSGLCKHGPQSWQQLERWVQSTRKKQDLAGHPSLSLPVAPSSSHFHLSKSIQLAPDAGSFLSLLGRLWVSMALSTWHLPDTHHTFTDLLNLCLLLHPKFHQGRAFSSIIKMYHSLPGTLWALSK